MPAYISALERQDIKNYPLEIAKIPQRDLDRASPVVHGRRYADIAASVENSHADETAISTTLPERRNSGKPFSLWERKDFQWGDIVDIINPLHHIPIVSVFYRSMTTDKIGVVPRLIGGALWGRIGGFVSAVVNAIVDIVTGKDIGEHIYAAVFGSPEKDQAEKVLAQAPEGKSSPLVKDASEAARVPDSETPPPSLRLSQTKGPHDETLAAGVELPVAVDVSGSASLLSPQPLLWHETENEERQIDAALTGRSLRSEQDRERDRVRETRTTQPASHDKHARLSEATVAALMKYEQASALYMLKPKRVVYLSA